MRKSINQMLLCLLSFYFLGLTSSKLASWCLHFTFRFLFFLLKLFQTEPELLHYLSLEQCQADPDTAITKGILEPLSNLVVRQNYYILIDGLCEAEYHRQNIKSIIRSF